MEGRKKKGKGRQRRGEGRKVRETGKKGREGVWKEGKKGQVCGQISVVIASWEAEARRSLKPRNLRLSWAKS